MICAITRGQWFNDGNKRTALMAANHVLINAGIGVFAISPSLKRDFTNRLLRYYESDDPAPLCAWLRDYAIGRLPGGLTSAESRRLETERIKSGRRPVVDGHVEKHDWTTGHESDIGMRATAPITCRAAGSRIGMAQGSAIDGPRPTDIGANASSPISDRKRKGPGPSGPWTIWSMTSNPWNKAKGSIDPNEPNRYRHADHVPIYRSRTEMVPYGPLITGRVHEA